MRCLGLPLAAALAAAGLTAAGALAGEYGPFKEQETKLGEVLATTNGMTLYTYDQDQPGVSTCVAKCAEHWPPVKASASDQPSDEFTIIKRADSTLQWAYERKPLYGYDGDMKAGDVEGDGKGSVWHVVKAD